MLCFHILFTRNYNPPYKYLTIKFSALLTPHYNHHYYNFKKEEKNNNEYRVGLKLEKCAGLNIRNLP